MTKTTKTHHAKKHVKVTHAHHKPYRKRHYAALIASIALGIAIINSLIIYANNDYIGRQIASQTISDVFGVNSNKSTQSIISSRYGFSLTYDTNRYYASGVDATNGELYVGSELSSSRAYNTIRLSDQRVNAQDASSFKLTYYQNDKATSSNLSELEKTYITQKQANQKQLTKGASQEQAYDGVKFLRTEWTRQLDTAGVNLKVGFTTYVGVVNGSPLTVIASRGVGGEESADAIMRTFATSGRTQALLPVSSAVMARYNSSLTVLDSILGVATASADAPKYTAAERISATYGPAVVKVYNVVVGDLAIDGRVVLRDQIAGGTGSGFIVSGDGYIATNGHVAVVDARDEIIYYAIQALQQGNDTPMQDLIVMSGTTNADVAGAQSATDVLKIVIKNLYDLPASRFSFVNSKQNLLVGLGEKQVDLKALVEKTLSRQTYSEEATIKAATLKQADYDGTILPSVTGKFTKSDVALIKINGTNYPMVKLGDITSIAQGGNLNIMGFPGVGSSNGVVSETKTAATLTTGKVSSKKKDTGDHSLIETDTEIGHGNSGGPAFDDLGEVVGIATYAVDPGGAGDGVLNYIRDIGDFKKIADKGSVDFTVSDTQRIWDEAIGQFYTARYKKAVANFSKVEQLYPNHPRVAELTAVAEKRIANGENIDDFPVVLVAVLAVIVLAGVGVSIFFIVRHKHGHNALVQGVVSGQVQPMTPGAPAQMIPAAIPPAQLFGQPASTPPVQPAFGASPQPVDASQQPQAASTPVEQPMSEVAQNPIEAAPDASQPEASQPRQIQVIDDSPSDPTQQS